MLCLCHAIDTDSLVGKWKTDKRSFGDSVIVYSFETNGTFTHSLQWINVESSTGTYRFTANAPLLTNQLVTVVDGYTNIRDCYFWGGALVIDSGRGPILNLKRIQPLKYEMDGSFDDWKSYQTGWKETRSLAERGLDMGERFVDLKELYYDNDAHYLYLFFKCEPTLKELGGGSGDLGYLYIDSDMNTNTGVKPPATVPGTDIEIYLPTGSGRKPVVQYWMKRWDYAFSFNQDVRQESSDAPATFMAHGKHGLELALPLADLQMSKGRKFALYYSFVPSPRYTRQVNVEIK